MLKLRLPRLLALGALTLGFFSTAFAQEFTPKRVGPVSQYGQLQAGRNALGQGRIYGNCPTYAIPGNEVQVKGMSLFWSNYTPNAQLWNRQIIEGLVNRHKIQIIRAPMAVDDNGWGNRHYFAETKTDYYQQLLDSVVVAAIENDIYVIIDYHSHVAADYTNRAMEFFKIQAKKWGGYNNVIFEIFNEPLCAHGSQGDNSNCENYGGMLKWGGIKKYADQVIPVIRRYSDNLIVVGTPQWDQYPNDAASDPIADNNVAYTFHYYAGTHMIEWEGMHAEQAMNDGLSVFVTEWGTVNADGAGNVSESNWSWQEWLNQNQLSSANWTVGKNKSGSEYFYIDFNPDGEWVYTESGQWMNDKVFSTLPENDSYTSCGLSYDQVPEDTWPVDEFGNVYEGGDYLIDNFDGKGIRYSSYHYGWNNDGGTWSYDENNSGAVYNSDVGSNVATITNISAGADGEGGVGYEISVDDGIAGCENLFYRFSGTAHTVKFVMKGDEDGALTGWDQHHLYVDGNDVWTTSFISTARDLEGGAIDLDLDKVVKIKFEMAGSKYDWFYMDDLQCATEMPSSSSSSSSSGSIVAEAYMVDNFSGNGTAEYDYVFADKWTIANDMVHPGWAIDDPDYMEYVKTTNDPEQGVVGAALQVTRVGNDDGGAGIGVHVPKNLSGCATLQYKYKGLEHNLAFFNEQEKVIYAEHFNRADKGWVTVTYDMNRAVAEGLDINSALDIQWHALEPDGETDLLIDDVECVAPVSSSSSSDDLLYVIDDFDGNQVDGGVYVYPYGGATVNNPIIGYEDEDPIYQVVFPGFEGNGVLNSGTAISDPGSDVWQGLVLEKQVFGISSKCARISYQYLGSAHQFRMKMPDAMISQGNFHSYRVFNDAHDWETVVVDISEVKQEDWGEDYSYVELDLSQVEKLAWELNNVTDAKLYIDNVQCLVEPTSSSSSALVMYLVDDFDGNGRVSKYGYDYVYVDGGSIGNETYIPDWAMDPSQYQYVVSRYDSELKSNVGAIVDIALDDAGSSAGLGMYLPDLSGCSELQYKYKGSAHSLALVNVESNMGSTGDNDIVIANYKFSDSWTDVSLDMTAATENGIDLDSKLEMKWKVLGPVDDGEFFIDDVVCIEGDVPSSSSSSMVPPFLVDDFDGNQVGEEPYVYAYNGGQYDDVGIYFPGEDGGLAVGIVNATTVTEPKWQGVVLEKPVPGLLGECARIAYSYRGARHQFRVNMPEVEDGNLHGVYVDGSDEWETAVINVSDLKQGDWGVAVDLDMSRVHDIRWELNGDVEGAELYIDDVVCLEAPVELPEPKAPTTNMELVDDFEDGDYLPLWSGVGNWWVDFAGPMTAASMSFVKGSQSSRALQVNFTLNESGIDYAPYAAISSNDFHDLNLGNCTEVRYDYKGAAHKFRIKFSSQINDLLHLDWNFHAFAVDARSESWQTVSIPLASLRQQYCNEEQCDWGSYVPLDTIMRRANGFDWRVDGADGDVDSLAIDNIRCIGLGETPYYTITFKNGDEDYEVKSWAAGSNVPDPAGVPAKAPDAQYTYVFDYWTWYENEWGYPTRLVVGDATYEAVYTEITNTYTVTFLLDDGETVYGQVEGVEYGTPVLSIAPPDPSKEDDSQFTYTFDGWDPSFDSETIVEGAITYKATYTQSLKSYDITFKDDDGTVLAKVSEFYGTPADEIEAPEVLGAAGKKFAGWNPGLARVTGEAVYTAVYTDKFVITWKDYNGDVLKTDFLDEGDMPEYGDDPTREATAQYSYVFAGWDHEVEEVTGDATYTAAYTETVNTYDVAFYDEDGVTVLEALADGPYEYGSLVKDFAPVAPTKAATDQYSYTFAGWNPEIMDETVVEGEATYTAVYTQTVNTYTVYFQGEEGVTNLPAAKTAEYGTLVSDLLPSSDPVKAPDARYTYEFEKWYDPITMDETMYLPADATLEGDMTLMAVFRKFDRKYLITFLNEDGSQYGTANLYAYGTSASDITPTEDPVKPADEQYSYVFAGWDPEVQDVTGEATYTATFTTESAETYTVTYKCFSYADGEYRFECTGLPEQVTVDAGTLLSSLVPKSTPVMTATAADAYTFNGWVLYADVDHQYDIGEDDVVEDVPFSHITLAAVFDWSLRQYTVAFVDEDGETVLKAAADYDYGTEFGDVVVPEVQPKEGKNFVGWTPTPSAVTGNVTYKAVYEDKVYYTVTYVCEDFTDGPEASTCINLPETKTVEAGTLVSTLIPTVNPEIPQTQQYVFDFSEWLIGDGDDIETVDENITITALFDWYLRQYTISFVDWNNTPIYSDSYEYGTEASIIVPAENPTRADDEQFSYTFADWTPTVADVTGDATYKATYTKTALSSSSSETVVSSSSEGTESSSSETVVSSSSETAPSSSSVVPSSSSTTPSSSSVKPSSSSVKPESSADEDDKSSSSRGKDRSSSSVSEDEPSSSEAKDDKDDKSSSSGKTDALFPTVAGLNMVFSHNELTVTVPKASEVKVQVFDMQGNLQERYQGYSAGDHVVSLRHLNKGVYIVRVASGSAVKTQRIMIK